MFLQPQHFQQQDGYHEARVRHYLHWLAPFAWGIKSLSSVRLRCRTTCVTLSGVNWSPGRGRLCVFRGTLSPAMRRFDRVLLRTCWILVAAPWGISGSSSCTGKRGMSRSRSGMPRGERDAAVPLAGSGSTGPLGRGRPTLHGALPPLLGPYDI